MNARHLFYLFIVRAGDRPIATRLDCLSGCLSVRSSVRYEIVTEKTKRRTTIKIGVHERYPGHYIHSLKIKVPVCRISKIFKLTHISRQNLRTSLYPHSCERFLKKY